MEPLKVLYGSAAHTLFPHTHVHTAHTLHYRHPDPIETTEWTPCNTGADNANKISFSRK